MLSVIRDVYTARQAKSRARRILQEATTLATRGRHKLGRSELRVIEEKIAYLRDCFKQNLAHQCTEAAEELLTLIERDLAIFRRPSWQENLVSIGYAVAFALIMRALVVEAFKIPSGSMIPTLAIGDQIFVNKYIYGPRLPFTTIRPLHFASPARGEVVVFICPVPPHEDYIKRIVAIAGDSVMVRQGEIFINGQGITRKSLGPVSHLDRDSSGNRWRAFRSEAFLESHGEHRYTTLQEEDVFRRAPDFGPETVPEGHVFVMGDNRDHSYDSRAWGPVPIDHILGRSQFIWWSWGRDGLETKRLGTWIH